MKKNFIFYLIVITFFIFEFSLASVVKKIKITGNDRIPDETILMFSNIQVNDEINSIKSNKIIKDLYETNFFENVEVKYSESTLFIFVKELPLINNITLEGIKAKKFDESIRNEISLKEKSSFNQFKLKSETKKIKLILKNFGYYFSTVDVYVEELDNKMVNIKFKISLGKKAKIKKISFIGDKVFKNKELRNVIISEEYKFWKFISSKKYLNEEIIKIDTRLLKNFYLNKGFYNVDINSSYAKLINQDEFELIYNISAKEKIFFEDFILTLSDEVDPLNYKNLSKIFNKLKGRPYSINSVEKILNEIDLITVNKEFKSVNAYVEENLVSNKLNLNFILEPVEQVYVEKINIFGNNITMESVIRNKLLVDEGDPYNEILNKRSENNIKSLNFFRNVKSETIEGKEKNSKIINITVEEKPTGEISAGAGVGTNGSTLMFGIKENNYLGKGLAVDANATISEETFKGKLGFRDPNFNNSDKAIFGNVQAIEIDRLANFGYKTNKTGLELGTSFESLEDFFLRISSSSYYEEIETDSTASARQKKQEGNYWDTFLNLGIDYDKRNQKYKTSRGFLSSYKIDMPIISDTNTLTNSYMFKTYTELYENNITSLSILLENANSISNDDVKLTERLFIPAKRLRGFESGKVGPKDGNDFIGGNYVTAINFNSTLPYIFPNLQELDVSFFFDIANVWGVDYDSSINDSNKIRSSIGIGVDWFTIIGPLTFSLSEAISKVDTDIEESFRFNIGTTF